SSQRQGIREPQHEWNPIGMAYVPTEDERRIFRECNDESFWYRCESSLLINHLSFSSEVDCDPPFIRQNMMIVRLLHERSWIYISSLVVPLESIF
uniref:OCIA domain-containing protein n=1 Tax=Terrapene triunguis TaxID=2587831 RepID=A0A674J9N8_9SAUR